MTAPKVEPPKDKYYHYQLVCQFCGETWWGLHCPHDGYQNPCPNCDRPPIPIKGNCTCELVAPIDVIKLQQEALLVWVHDNRHKKNFHKELDAKLDKLRLEL